MAIVSWLVCEEAMRKITFNFVYGTKYCQELVILGVDKDGDEAEILDLGTH